MPGFLHRTIIISLYNFFEQVPDRMTVQWFYSTERERSRWPEIAQISYITRSCNWLLFLQNFCSYCYCENEILILCKTKEKASVGFMFRGGGGRVGVTLFFYKYAINVPLIKLHKIDTYFSSWDKSRWWNSTPLVYSKKTKTTIAVN